MAANSTPAPPFAANVITSVIAIVGPGGAAGSCQSARSGQDQARVQITLQQLGVERGVRRLVHERFLQHRVALVRLRNQRNREKKTTER